MILANMLQPNPKVTDACRQARQWSVTYSAVTEAGTYAITVSSLIIIS
jgi:hypothetical protein